jgi:cytochrome c biogenesis protein CcmG/thiol:disulfide interchange protein DsbE
MGASSQTTHATKPGDYMNTSLVNKSMLAGALALAVCAQLAFAGGKGVKVGDTFPEFNSFGLEGKMPDDLKGKVVLVDFWASWCGPCKESFPVMEEMQQKYGSKGLVILAVNVDEDVAAMKDFLKDHPATFTIVHDAKKQLVGLANISSMPTSIVLGKDGKVAAIHKGFHGKETAKQYAKEFDELLGANLANK